MGKPIVAVTGPGYGHRVLIELQDAKRRWNWPWCFPEPRILMLVLGVGEC